MQLLHLGYYLGGKILSLDRSHGQDLTQLLLESTYPGGDDSLDLCWEGIPIQVGTLNPVAVLVLQKDPLILEVTEQFESSVI